jgi:hypothetical protein
MAALDVSGAAGFPRMNSRSLARFLTGSPAVKRSTLKSTKHSQDDPYKPPVIFYQPTKSAIRGYFLGGHSTTVVKAALVKAQSLRPQARKDNNIRAMQAFLKCDLASRNLAVLTKPNTKISLGGVQLSVSADYLVSEGRKERYLFVELGHTPIPADKAQLTVDLAYFLLRAASVVLRPEQVELFELCLNRSYFAQDHRTQIERQLVLTMPSVKQIWAAV